MALGLRRHGYSFNKFKLNRCIQVHQLSKTWWTQLSCAWIYKVFLKFRDLTSIELSVSDQVVWNLTATQKVVVVQSYTIQKMKKSLMKNSVFCANDQSHSRPGVKLLLISRSQCNITVDHNVVSMSIWRLSDVADGIWLLN